MFPNCLLGEPQDLHRKVLPRVQELSLGTQLPLNFNLPSFILDLLSAPSSDAQEWTPLLFASQLNSTAIRPSHVPPIHSLSHCCLSDKFLD